MNISGIRPSIGQVNYIPQFTRAEQAKNEPSINELSKAPQQETNQVSKDEISAARSKQTFGAYDYASAYKPGQTFEMKGTDSDLNSLDVQQAVTDMRRDSALQQYQYFVGNQNAAESVASVRGAEDFSL